MSIIKQIVNEFINLFVFDFIHGDLFTIFEFRQEIKNNLDSNDWNSLESEVADRFRDEHKLYVRFRRSERPNLAIVVSTSKKDLEEYMKEYPINVCEK